MFNTIRTQHAPAQSAPLTTLYPPLEPRRSGHLAVDAVHTLYWEECGNPTGVPVLFLHGGPGAGISPKHRQFFNPDHYRIILFDQRGAGQSTPSGECRNNTLALLLEDIEHIRTMLGIEQWLVFGGSWGSTLALAYGQAHPECCLGFILRGIFLGSLAEIDWFMHGMQWFFPDRYADFVQPIAPAERQHLLASYHERLFSPDAATRLAAARAWTRYEERCVHLLPQLPADEDASSDAQALALSRLEAHYFSHACFLAPGQLLSGVECIRHLPAVIVQGRYDVVCPPANAWRLHQAWPQASLQIVPDAGHSAFEPSTTSALVEATNQFMHSATL